MAPSATGMGPVAFADLRKGPAQAAAGELSDPAVPTPTESLIAGKAKAVAPGEAVAELAEPDPNGKGITAIGGAAPAKAISPGTGELASPAVPSPSESIAAEHPAVIAGGERTVTLEPAVPRPPVAAVAPAVPAPAPAAALVPAKPVQPTPPAAVATVTSPSPAGAVQAPASVPILKGLAKGSFYVQIGVYGTNDALGAAVAGFKSTHYPLAVEKLTTKKGSPAFRLFVGPLSRDESGLVLIRIRSLGFKDAYIRQGT
jgi:cell division septation protein DedD